MLPSNDSLHEDLILEELEVFQVLLTHHFLFCKLNTASWLPGATADSLLRSHDSIRCDAADIS